MATVEVKLQAVFTLQQDGHLYNPNALIQVRQLLVPTDVKDKRHPTDGMNRDTKRKPVPFPGIQP
jgi:hypothetical protein